MAPLKVGIIGCGNISGIYALNLSQTFLNLQLTACANPTLHKAQALAEKYSIPKVCSVDELLASDDIDLVINLTVPSVHAEITLKALETGKHVYSEKPLAITREDGLKIIQKAKEKGLMLGCAPDTFLGGGLQTCRKLLDDGWIGQPLGATAFMMGSGPESWHPNPDFFYQTGGGPLFDVGPYYLTALVSLLGPVARVSGSAHISLPYRTITGEHRFGEKIPVEVPTHISGVLDFASGTVGTVITSFDIFGGSRLPFIEIYGSEGTLSLPDPNTFGGPVLYKRKGMTEWREIPLLYGFTENSRGLGAADMALNLKENRPNRASGELAFHVLDIMQGLYDASLSGVSYKPISTCQRPEPFPLGFTAFMPE